MKDCVGCILAASVLFFLFIEDYLLKKVVSISSGSCSEAKYFKKESQILFYVTNKADGVAVASASASISSHSITIGFHIIGNRCATRINTTCRRPIVNLTIRCGNCTATTLSCTWQEDCTVCLKNASPIGGRDFVIYIQIIKIARCCFVTIIQSVISGAPIVW